MIENRYFALLEWDTSTSREDPRQWGPFDTERERDNQLALALLENAGRRILFLDFSFNPMTSEAHLDMVYSPSMAYRDDLLRAIDANQDNVDDQDESEGDLPSELTGGNATRMWDSNNPSPGIREWMKSWPSIQDEGHDA